MKYEKSCCRHLFAIGSASYGKMMKDTENQVIVIRSVYPECLVSPYMPNNLY